MKIIPVWPEGPSSVTHQSGWEYIQVGLYWYIILGLADICAILTPSVPPAMRKAPQDPDRGLLSQLINPHAKQFFQALKSSSTPLWLETSRGRSTICGSLVLNVNKKNTLIQFQHLASRENL